MKTSLEFILSDIVLIMLIIVGILTFMSMITFGVELIMKEVL